MQLSPLPQITSSLAEHFDTCARWEWRINAEVSFRAIFAVPQTPSGRHSPREVGLPPNVWGSAKVCLKLVQRSGPVIWIATGKDSAHLCERQEPTGAGSGDSPPHFPDFPPLGCLVLVKGTHASLNTSLWASPPIQFKLFNPRLTGTSGSWPAIGHGGTMPLPIL